MTVLVAAAALLAVPLLPLPTAHADARVTAAAATGGTTAADRAAKADTGTSPDTGASDGTGTSLDTEASDGTASATVGRSREAARGGAARGRDGDGWRGAWATSVQPPGRTLLPNWSQEGFKQQSLRQVVRVSTGGTALRFKLSNRYGSTSLRVAGAAVGRTGKGAAVRAGTSRALAFGEEKAVTVPAGGEVFSDALRMRVGPLESLTLTLYLAEPTGPATYHMSALTTSYRAPGDLRFEESGEAFTDTSVSWYYVADVEVRGGPTGRGNGVVTFGDSITDGFASTVDADNRYPDELAERYAREGRPRGVLNHGISGNMITYGTPGTGESGVNRFKKDVLPEPGVSTVVVLEGINDVGLSELPGSSVPDISVEQLIAAHRDIIRQARAKGLKVIGATLTPFKGAVYFSERGEAKRDALNEWIRTSGAYDRVIDLDRALADPADRDRLVPAYDSGDHLHPSDAGYHAIAEAIDVDSL
ncbi:SGNH hydrolase [Streptomyces longispororuber]|uniref:SGNH hydrolase n=1 Tax=Streptomyces longispororuber TaxID=68230 RepID=A0A918ZIT0_9ACTN|nr:SGNH/GDSL hydrolase family protein [Streptomyces longispororuber]GHE53727.1 SGNH hydrolase [Streptomyces longispororuber]